MIAQPQLMANGCQPTDQLTFEHDLLLVGQDLEGGYRRPVRQRELLSAFRTLCNVYTVKLLY